MRKFICLLLWGLIMASCGERSNEKKLRILTCGIRHESNTFSTLVTDLSSFDVLRGEEVLGEKCLWSEYLKGEGVEVYLPSMLMPGQVGLLHEMLMKCSGMKSWKILRRRVGWMAYIWTCMVLYTWRDMKMLRQT